MVTEDIFKEMQIEESPYIKGFRSGYKEAMEMEKDKKDNAVYIVEKQFDFLMKEYEKLQDQAFILFQNLHDTDDEELVKVCSDLITFLRFDLEELSHTRKLYNAVEFSLQEDKEISHANSLIDEVL